MNKHDTTPSSKQLAQVVTATLLVAGCPVAAVWWLRASGTVSSAVLAVAVGMALSLCASHVGCRVWEKRPGSEDLLFSELMIWGFVHRWHSKRRLASALDTLGPMGDPQQRAVDAPGTNEQAKLLERMVAQMETRDPYLHGHSRRVARHSWMIARRMGLSRMEVARIRTAAALHDVGKTNTPKAILHKAGPLTDDEYDVIKRHPGDGAVMTGVLGDPELTAMVRHHHERLDGTGYPSLLSGEEIPLGARIIAVADTFDAITSARPYRPASPHKKAIDILKSEAGKKLDPAVVRAFCGHRAGRRPLVLWSFIVALPERVVSWLGGSLASVAAAGKVLAVAAIVGGAAAATSTLGLAPAHAHPAKHQVVPVSTLQAQGPRRRAPVTVALPVRSGSPARRVEPTHTHARTRPVHRSVAVRTTVPSPSSQESIPGPSSAPPAGGTSSKGTTGESPGKARGGEPPPKAKGEESPGKGKSEESPSKGKSGEAPGKSGEAPGKSGEAPGKSGEAHGKSAEASGKSAETPTSGTSEAPHGKAK